MKHFITFFFNPLGFFSVSQLALLEKSWREARLVDPSRLDDFIDWICILCWRFNFYGSIYGSPSSGGTHINQTSISRRIIWQREWKKRRPTTRKIRKTVQNSGPIGLTVLCAISIYHEQSQEDLLYVKLLNSLEMTFKKKFLSLLF